MPSLLQGPAAVAHLLRRAGFGPRADTWARWAAMDYDAAVDAVLAELDAPAPEDPPGLDVFDPGRIQQVWLERMLAAPCGLAEKLTLFWHNHFATSYVKVQDLQLMWTQYRLLRAHGAGRFRELLLGISRDVAMIRWLDGNANRAGHGNANENYARELQELFTLGIGNYTEQDIREVARAFTGWGSSHYDFRFEPRFHDGGTKTIHGRTGPFDGGDVIDILVALPACPRHLARKLWASFVGPEPSEAQVDAYAARLREVDLDMRSALALLFRDEAFRAAGAERALVRGPVEFVVGALRAMGSTGIPGWAHGSLDRQGQILFQPPSVKGWTSGRGWLSSGAVVDRLATAQLVAQHHEFTVAPQPLADPLEVAFQGRVPPALAAVLAAAPDEAQRVALALGSPEFQLA